MPNLWAGFRPSNDIWGGLKHPRKFSRFCEFLIRFFKKGVRCTFREIKFTEHGISRKSQLFFETQLFRKGVRCTFRIIQRKKHKAFATKTQKVPPLRI